METIIFLIKWLTYLIISFVIIFVGLGFFFESKKRNSIRNVKTKEKLPGPNIFSIWIYKILYSNIPFSKYLQDKTKGLKIYGYFMLHRFIVSVSDPNLAQKIMSETDLFIKKPANQEKGFLGGSHIVRLNGEEWKNQRTILNKAFYNFDIFNDVFLEKSEILLNLLKKKRNEKTFEITNFENIIQNFTIDILGKTIFGYEFNALSEELNKELVSYNFIMDRVFTFQHLLFSKLKTASNNLFPYGEEFEKSTKEIDNLCLNLIQKSKKKLKNENEKVENLLDFMVESQLDSNSTTKFSNEQIQDNVRIFFISGHETTLTSILFELLLLSKYQSVQQKIRNEILNFEFNEKFNEKLKDLEYLSMFIKETMRFFPPVTHIPARLVSKDCILNDFKIPKGSLIGISTCNSFNISNHHLIDDIHHSKEIYGDPEIFRPERWSNEEQIKRKIPNNCFIPFLSGPRTCIGNNFTLLEQKIVLIKILQNFKLSLFNPNDEILSDPTKIGLSGPIMLKIKFEDLK